MSTKNKVRETLTQFPEDVKMRIIYEKNVASRIYDLACWTPIAPLVRKLREVRIENIAENIRFQRKTEILCRKLARQYSELTTPAW